MPFCAICGVGHSLLPLAAHMLLPVHAHIINNATKLCLLSQFQLHSFYMYSVTSEQLMNMQFV